VVEAVAELYEPCKQLMHDASDEAVHAVSMYLPASHVEQAAHDVSDESVHSVWMYLPASHVAQATHIVLHIGDARSTFGP
jgi:predicted CoA-binding protein